MVLLFSFTEVDIIFCLRVQSEAHMKFYNQNNDTSNFSIAVSDDRTYTFGIFAKGYHLAANVLNDELAKKFSVRDYEVYPLIFLLRHAFELYLKDIIYKTRRIRSNIESTAEITKLIINHDLAGLSRDVEKILSDLHPNEKEMHLILKGIVKTATELSEIDPNSFTFRYPIEKNGKPSLDSPIILNRNAIFSILNSVLAQLEVFNFGLSIEKEKSTDYLGYKHWESERETES